MCPQLPDAHSDTPRAPVRPSRLLAPLAHKRGRSTRRATPPSTAKQERCLAARQCKLLFGNECTEPCGKTGCGCTRALAGAIAKLQREIAVAYEMTRSGCGMTHPTEHGIRRPRCAYDGELNPRLSRPCFFNS